MARWSALGVAALLALHLALAERSLVAENPTVDEVAHLPAGVTYWQKGTFRLYHHNPPLVKLVAALPVVLARPVTEPLYQQPSWTARDPSQPTFGQSFALLNADRYFELFRLARMVMPLFSVLGGWVVYAWSSRLHGRPGGFLSLTLWCFCPNVLAHARLVTGDVGATAVGVAATYVFWRYLQDPGWKWAVGAGVALGLAQLTKFSLLLLLAVWPLFGLAWLVLAVPGDRRRARLVRGLRDGLLMIGLCVLVIDAGYLFEGVGIPLGRYEFASRSLTRPIEPTYRRAQRPNPLYDILLHFRENRFRGTILEKMPMPLPEHYLLGFDEQKIDTEGIPLRCTAAMEAINRGDMEQARVLARTGDDRTTGYRVYLDGELRDHGWWYYYLATLIYKVPEGTWLLVLWGVGLLARDARKRPARAWADELILWTLPCVILVSISLLTDINIGLRYVLPIAPYVFIATGKVVPWVEQKTGPARQAGRAVVAACLGLTIAATVSIHPSYLAYFNWASGGPDRQPPHLIDSNLDWGQDLVGLREWCRRNIPGEKIGLAYFGQINPSIYTLRDDPWDWFLPPVAPGTTVPMPSNRPRDLVGPAPRLTPGYYAVSASLVHGLPWRLYDSSRVLVDAWQPAWNAAKPDAFGYFRKFKPIHHIGHSIYIYRLTEADLEENSPD
jgi:hypothetical protein